MRYAVHYNRTFRYFDEVDEVIFDYKGSEAIVDFIPKTLKEYQKAIINLIQIKDVAEVISYLNKLKTLHSNFVVQISLFNQTNIIELLQDNEIEYMFADFARDYDTFYTMRELGAKEIYIVEGLAFNLRNLQEIRKEEGLSLRVFPDIAQSARGTTYVIPPVTKFWIRPEDTELYEQYVDVFELCRTDDKQSVIYEVYKNQQWLGQLEDIILDFDTTLDNTSLDPRFGQERINCGKRCNYGRCNLCTEMEDLAARFKLVGITIQKPKKKNEITTEEKERMLSELKERGKEINESQTDKETV